MLHKRKYITNFVSYYFYGKAAGKYQDQGAQGHSGRGQQKVLRGEYASDERLRLRHASQGA